ncbi:glycosyltransferase [Paraburkholderia lacunae]|uniref:Group 1 glycosyl transferase n=1 Tax=Paraburkholderia lacunae TaxID=2211104 RepID=A0A370NB07_9BURK|nr:glycosyltransferase [Paraburkholderia lacunae]RDK02782.1 group 1 glycosyl transferase [Paraburkholderia lacunae]
MNILFVVPFLPQENAPQAGHRLAYEYIKKLCAEATVDVLIISRTEISTDDIRLPHGVENVYVKVVKRLSALHNALKFAFKVAPRFFSRYERSVETFVSDLVSKRGYEVVRLEFSQTFIYAEELRCRFGSNISLHFGVHDVQIQLVLRRTGPEGNFFAKQTFDLEGRLFSLADKIFVLSKKDKNLISSMYAGVKSVEIMPIILPRIFSSINRTQETIKAGNILFWGAMGRIENEEAAIGFIESTFMPLIRKGVPLKLFIVGSSPTVRMTGYRSDSICVTGFVQDPSEYFRAAQIGVVPLISGAGVKLKTLEMLAAGLPVISTPVGAEGIEYDGNLLTVCGLERFGEVIESLHYGHAAFVRDGSAFGE